MENKRFFLWLTCVAACFFLQLGPIGKYKKHSPITPKKGLSTIWPTQLGLCTGIKLYAKRSETELTLGLFMEVFLFKPLGTRLKKNLQITTTHYPLLEVYVEVFRGKSYESHHFYPKKRLEGAIKGA